MKLRVALAAMLFAMLALVPAAHAADWQKSKLLNPVVITVQGQQVPDGCRYDYQEVVRPGDLAVETQEISDDPNTCTMFMKQGTPVDAFAADFSGVGDDSVSESAQLRSPTSGGASIQSTTRSAGFHRAWLEDPVGIDVNKVKNDIEWSWDNPYLTPGPEDFCDGTLSWYSTSGWGLHEHNLQCNGQSPVYPSLWVDSTNYAHFKNGVFCALTDTDAYYNRNHAYGYGNGNLVGAHSVTKSGTCSFMLSLNSETARTMN